MDELEPTHAVVVAPHDPLAELRLALLRLDEQRAALAAAGDTAALAWGAADLEAVIGDLRDLHRATRADLARLVDADHAGRRGRPTTTIEGLGIVEVWGGMERRNWQSSALLKLLLLRAITDADGAFIHDLTPLDLVDHVFAVLNDCLPLTGSLAWRVGMRGKGNGLRGYGIEVEDYCDEVEQPRLAKVPRRKR